MEFYLQFGWGMMELSRELIERWGGGRVILSPRDLNPDQLEPFAESIGEVGGEVLFDPQFYLPDANHHRLITHDHWPDGYDDDEFWESDDVNELVENLSELNDTLGCPEFILPGVHGEKIDDKWIARQGTFINIAQEYRDDRPAFATVSLGSDAVRNDDQVQEVLEASEEWPVDGIYLVCEHPNDDYLVEDPNWLANLLDLTAGFKLGGRRVLIGYANQQTLIAAAAGADAIASGNWLNTRMFSPAKFEELGEAERKQRAKWYYCAPALTEFKYLLLDIAKKAGVLDQMRIPDNYGCDYSDPLFAGGQPSVSDYDEPASFRHYLQCLKYQANIACRNTFERTTAFHRARIAHAAALLEELHGHRINGSHRDFAECVDLHDAALQILIDTRGGILSKKWDKL